MVILELKCPLEFCLQILYGIGYEIGETMTLDHPNAADTVMFPRQFTYIHSHEPTQIVLTFWAKGMLLILYIRTYDSLNYGNESDESAPALLC